MQGLHKKSKSKPKPKTPKRKKSISNEQTQLLNKLDEVLNKVKNQ
jgi:hypothetical protein